MVATKLLIALWLFSRFGLPLTVESFFNSSPSWFSAWGWQCTQFPCWLSALSGCSVHSTQFPASQNAKALSLPFSLFIILHGIVKLSGTWSSGFDVFSIKCDWFVVIWLAPSEALHYEHFCQWHIWTYWENLGTSSISLALYYGALYITLSRDPSTPIGPIHLQLTVLYSSQMCYSFYSFSFFLSFIPFLLLGRTSWVSLVIFEIYEGSRADAGDIREWHSSLTP